MGWLAADNESDIEGASEMVGSPPIRFRYIVQANDGTPPDSADVGWHDPLGLWGPEVQIQPDMAIQWQMPAGHVSVQYTLRDLDEVQTPRTPSDTDDDLVEGMPIETVEEAF